MNKKRIGLALCGSYCTYEKLFGVLGTLCERYADPCDNEQI